jgi:DNA-binding transcriptional ArsR family regulator
MPTLVDEASPTVRVAPSAPLELMWVLHFIQSDHEHEGAFAALEPMRRRYGPQLSELRDDGLAQYSTELVVLAHRTGTLLDLDLTRFFDRIEKAATTRGPLPSLRSEKPAELKVVAGRLESLRTDAAHRARYLDLLATVWKGVESEWRGEGRAAVVSEAERWAQVIETQGGYRDVLGLARLWPGRPQFDDMADAAAADGSLVLNPCWFGGKIHMIELDGTVYLGRGIRHGAPPYRKVAAEVSANMKALADPTRLTILLRLAQRPASVTELARHLHLSQPTVSAHVQVLREVGLLEERAVGRSAELSASEEGLRRLFARSEESMVRLFRS